jgi:hypothetical protein
VNKAGHLFDDAVIWATLDDKAGRRRTTGRCTAHGTQLRGGWRNGVISSFLLRPRTIEGLGQAQQARELLRVRSQTLQNSAHARLRQGIDEPGLLFKTSSRPAPFRGRTRPSASRRSTVVLLTSTRRPRRSTGTRSTRIPSRRACSLRPSRCAASATVYVGRPPEGDVVAALGDAAATTGDATADAATLPCCARAAAATWARGPLTYNYASSAYTLFMTPTLSAQRQPGAW